jgi:hypothetical protein
MSFEEHPDCFVWACNKCDYFVAFKPHDFWACVAELRSRGWGFYLDQDTGREDSGRDWTHTCPSCRHKHRQPSMLDRRFQTVKGSGG